LDGKPNAVREPEENSPRVLQGSVREIYQLEEIFFGVKK
jgi:hypothetical protein